MANWQEWQKVSDGPYQGRPELLMMGLGMAGYAIEVRDTDGNFVHIVPAVSGTTGDIVNLGGAGLIAHLPAGNRGMMRNFVGTGKDKRLYIMENDPKNGRPIGWRQIEGPGQFLGAVFSQASMDGTMEILGEGLDHQLAYASLTLEQREQNNIAHWDNLGQPGLPGGKMGMNGSPAVIRDRMGNMHVLAQGQDNHLWHLIGKMSTTSNKPTFGKWKNLGGGITRIPVLNHTSNGFDCFVVGEQKEVQVNSWNGKKWSGFFNLEGQLKGLPAAISPIDPESPFVFGRGVHNKLWYRQRKGSSWTAWESIGEGIDGDPGLIAEPLVDSSTGTRLGGTISCFVLRHKGELWQRTLKLNAADYQGK